MPFITIPPGGDEAPALCLCYLEWLESGRVPAGGADPQDNAQLGEVYDFVQAGDSFSPVIGQQDSDPIRMMMLLYPKYRVELYCLSAQFPQYFNAVTVNRRNQAFIDRVGWLSRILDETPPAPPDWGSSTSALVMCSAVDQATGAQIDHCVLYRKGYSGESYRYDPWQGMAEPAWNYEPFTSGNFQVTPVNVALLIR